MKTLKTAFIIILFTISQNVFANTTISHAIAMHGEPKYNKDFLSVEYVSNNAEKGGNIVRSSIGTYDTFNPFTLKGTSAAGIGFLYESLTTGSSDEAFTEYGLLAETIEWPEDRSWVAFTLRDEAIWHDRKKISSEDVIWTFNTLIEKGHPFYKYYYGDVSEVIKLSENKVKFIFSTNTNKELPLIVGQLPVLPQHYWEDRNFEETTLDIPIGSGPYKIKSFDAGRSITYELNEDYWAFKNTSTNKNPYVKYAGYSFALRYCMSNLYKRNSKKARILSEEIFPGVKKNFNDINEFWKKYQNPFEPIFKKTYDKFLKINNQKSGIASYNEMVSLVIFDLKNDINSQKK